MPKSKRAPRVSGTRAQAWCFTCNNPEGLPTAEDFADVEYMVFQEELAPDTGTYHLQGYIRFDRRKTFAVVQEAFGDLSPHLEVAKGTPVQNREYCTKDSSRLPGSQPYEYGVCPKLLPGQRNDIVQLRDAVTAGKSFMDIAGNDETCGTLARHMPFYNRLVVEASPPIQRPDLKVTFCVGPPGTGKSTCCGLFDASVPFYSYDGNLGGFWDGYTGQKRLILDEMCGNVFKPTDFNRVCDKGPYLANIKGSSRYLAATDIRIASNTMPSSWWSSNTKWIAQATYRRIHECHYHPKQGEVHTFVTGPNGEYAIDNMRAYFNVMGLVQYL